MLIIIIGLLINVSKSLNWFSYRPETPPNTPQHAQAAARQNECNNCVLDSPQRHRTPQIEPLRFNGNISVPPAPLNPVIGDDPFALPVGSIHFNRQ